MTLVYLFGLREAVSIYMYSCCRMSIDNKFAKELYTRSPWKDSKRCRDAISTMYSDDIRSIARAISGILFLTILQTHCHLIYFVDFKSQYIQLLRPIIRLLHVVKNVQTFIVYYEINIIRVNYIYILYGYLQFLF